MSLVTYINKFTAQTEDRKTENSDFHDLCAHNGVKRRALHHPGLEAPNLFTMYDFLKDLLILDELKAKMSCYVLYFMDCPKLLFFKILIHQKCLSIDF